MGALSPDPGAPTEERPTELGHRCKNRYWFSLESARGFELYRMLAAGRAIVSTSGTMQNHYRTERGSAGW